ncbi:MAG: putative oxidoreductase [Deltaproteobacteria bacterium]|nr:putative oxidoreductase [Deltaproteobacteria bacterium]
MAGSLEGRTALVTGGGTGIGFGCARRLLEHGARVTIAARRLDVLTAAADRLHAAVPGAEVRVCQCDVTVEEEVAAAVRMAAGADGQLDIAVANAGSAAPGPILALTAEHWRYASDLNVLGTALTVKQAALVMQRRGGSIVAISSGAGVQVERFMATYCATKAGLEMLVRCAAVELAPFKIRVNCIQPGYVPTEGTALGFDDTTEKTVIDHTPLARPGTAEEIGDAVVYFCADSGAWVTGQTIAVDGGLTIPVGEDFEMLCRRMYGDELMDRCVGPRRG